MLDESSYVQDFVYPSEDDCKDSQKLCNKP